MTPSLRSLPRVFMPGLDVQQESYELPKDEVDKFRKVLRLAEGDAIAVLPNDGTLIRCEFRARRAWPLSIEHPSTEPIRKVVLAQALPKGDRLETVLRMGTELGVTGFVIFPAERSVVRWEPAKVAEKQRRYEAIIGESAEQAFRCYLPSLRFMAGLAEVLNANPSAWVLSELETEQKLLSQHLGGTGELTFVIGPEGGWAPREVALIGDRGVSMGPLVFRTDTAGVAAAAAALILVSGQ